MKGAVVVHRDFAISLPPQQFVHQVGDRDAAVARELIALEDTHGAETGLRPQSLATQ